jgi:hypothetical protein
MFGFKKADNASIQQTDTLSTSPFLNDGNPIHQAIIGLKKGDTTQVKKLFDAMASTPVFFPMAEAGNLNTGASLPFNNEPHLSVYTRREFIANENAGEYPHLEKLLLSDLSLAVNNDAVGVLINPGHPEVGAPVSPKYFKLFREAVVELLPPLKTGDCRLPPVEATDPLRPDSPICRLMGEICRGDESKFPPLFSLLADTVVVLPLKEPGRLETACVVGFQGTSYILAFTEPGFIDLAPAAKVCPHRALLTVRELCMRIVKPNTAMSLNIKHPNYSVTIVPRYFQQLLRHLRSMPQQARVAVGPLPQTSLSPMMEGGLYRVRHDNGSYAVFKILKIDQGGVHVRLYSNSFSQPPAHVDESTLFLVGRAQLKPGVTLGVKHLSLPRISYYSWSAAFVQQSSVDDDELGPWRKWLEAKGEYFHEGSQFNETPEERADDLEAAIVKLRSGDEQVLPPFLAVLAQSRVTVLLREPGKLQSCLTLEQNGTIFLAVFIRPEESEKWRANGYDQVAEIFLADLCVLMDSDDVGLSINPGHPQFHFPMMPELFKRFREAQAAVRPPFKGGGLYYVRDDDGRFSILKILKADDSGVHIRQYSNTWPAPPLSVDESKLCVVGMDPDPAEKLGAGHLPISKKSFAKWNAKFVQQSIVSERELDGYKMWLEAQGGYF